MNQVRTVLSTYTADVSGVCSALYELGGMVVIHDPSGCNSTYNTHDEPRWYDMDSLIFISGLSEIDAIMGNDDKFIRDVLSAAEIYHPKFIVLVRSPIPLMTGVDFESIAEIIESESGIPTWFIPTTGMNSYLFGAGEAFRLLAEQYVDFPDNVQENRQNKTNMIDDSREELLESEYDIKQEFFESGYDIKQELLESEPVIRANIIGETPLDFSINSTLDSLKSSLKSHNIEIVSSWAMGDSLENVCKAAQADINLVVSSSGYKAAKILEEKHQIPYVLGIPTGMFSQDYYRVVRQSVKDRVSRLAYQNVNNYIHQNEQDKETSTHQSEQDKETSTRQNEWNKETSTQQNEWNKEASTRQNEWNKETSTQQNEQDKNIIARVCIVGEPVISQSIAAAIRLKGGQYANADVRVLCPLDADKEVYGPDCYYVPSEEDMQIQLSQADLVIADPMYRYICLENVGFISLPHEAFSGRIYRKNIPDLICDFI